MCFGFLVRIFYNICAHFAKGVLAERCELWLYTEVKRKRNYAEIHHFSTSGTMGKKPFGTRPHHSYGKVFGFRNFEPLTHDGGAF